MNTFLATWLAWTALCLVTIVALLRWRRLAVVVTALGALLVLTHDHAVWTDWFAQAKTLTILFAAFTWAFGMGVMRYPYISTLATLVLMANILEVGLAELQARSWCNGVMVVIVGLCGPLPAEWREAPEGQLGFDSPAWIVANLSTFVSFYLCNPVADSLWVQTTTVLVIPALAALWRRDAAVWMSWRMYALFYFLTLYNLFPGLGARLQPQFLPRAARQAFQTSPLYTGLLVLSGVLALGLLRERWRVFRGPSRPTAAPC